LKNCDRCGNNSDCGLTRVSADREKVGTMIFRRHSWALALAGALPSGGANEVGVAEKKLAIRISEVPLVKSEHKVVENPGTGSLVASLDRRHVAYVLRQEDGRQAVALDGQPGRFYAWIYGSLYSAPMVNTSLMRPVRSSIELWSGVS
jgi:hypothetical protein